LGKENEMGEACSMHVKMSSPCKVLVGKPRRRTEDNIKNISYGNRVWTGFIWLRIGTGDGFL
jgi:hypothetical protein